METKELKIKIPKGQEIDWQESAKQEKIVFKKKDTKPRSWEEYLKLNTGFDGSGIDWNIVGGIQATGLHHRGKAIVPTHLAQPFIAMMQLMSLRDDWIHKWSIDSGMTDDWKPDWANCNETKYCLAQSENIIRVYDFYTANHTLSFPTEEMATYFMDCFKDLLKIAKPLI